MLAAIEWQAQEFQSQTGIKCILQTSLQDTEWNQDLNTAFFRIFQETLTNVIRHARAQRVEIELAAEDAALRLSISDDGSGGVERSGNGLSGMRERVVALGGTLDIESPRGGGTRLVLRLPVAAALEPPA